MPTVPSVRGRPRRPGAVSSRVIRRFRASLVLAGVLSLGLAACDRPKETEAPRLRMLMGEERATPITWDGQAETFNLAGKPLRTVRLWTFDGSTEGFTATRSELEPAEGEGLHVKVLDPTLRSPKGLTVDGGVYSLVLVRLTRLKAGGRWDGALYYSTPLHGEAVEFFARPVLGADPSVGETSILVYDMRRPAAGGEDWKTAEIQQIRVDLEHEVGGEFLIHQVAIAERADLSPYLPPPSPPPPEPQPAG